MDMVMKKLYIEPEQWDKLTEIAQVMEQSGKKIRDARGNISKAAVIRELINAFDLPAKPKGNTLKIGN